MLIPHFLFLMLYLNLMFLFLSPQPGQAKQTVMQGGNFMGVAGFHKNQEREREAITTKQ